MKQSEQLARRCKEALLAGLGIANTSYKDQLKDFTWKQATTQIGSLNSIASLTFHVNYYILGILPVFEGGSLKISDQYSFEALPIPSKTEGEHRLNTLLKNGAVLIDKIEKRADKELVPIFVDKK